MGIGIRVFLIDDNDTLHRISMARLDRLLHFDRRESFHLYAEKRVRCAMVVLEVEGRQVLVIRNADYFLLPFDDKGRIDKREWEKGMRLGMDLLPSSFKEKNHKRIINASHRFAKRRYEHEFKWKPSRKVEEAIVGLIFQST